MVAVSLNALASHSNALGDPDDLTAFGELMRDPERFYPEYERLLDLFTDPADPASVARGTNDQRFVLSSRVEDGRAGLSLTGEPGGERWTLWAWSDVGLAAADVEVLDDRATAGGRHLEVSIAGGLLTVTLDAHWIRGRFLQVERELRPGGPGLLEEAPAGFNVWVVDGPSLPYRFIPAERGPYGVVREEGADGNWHGADYPLWSFVPAVAAYDRENGILLAVADQHARLLDRSYQLLYRLLPSGSDGEQLAVVLSEYQPPADRYGPPLLGSGEPFRDTVVVEPFTIAGRSVDPNLLEAETAEVIDHVGAMVRAFHFIPRPPTALEAGNAASIEEWMETEGDIGETVRWLHDEWNVRYTEAWLRDATLDYGGKVGIGAAELPGGSGLAEQVREQLRQVDQQLMPLAAYCNFLVFTRDDAYYEAHPDWIARDEQGNGFNKLTKWPENFLLDVRNPEVATWAVRKMQADLVAYPEIAGYRFDTTATVPVEGQSAVQGPYSVSYFAAAYATYLRTAEALTAARPGAVLASNKGLRLCLPAFCNLYGNGDGSFGIGFSEEAADPAMPFENRLSNTVYNDVFGVQPTIGFGGHSLSAQVIATTAGVRGYTILAAMEEHAGFGAFVSHLEQLRAAGGELRVLHSMPQSCAYDGCGGLRPAVADELVCVLPANLDAAETVWVAFHGIGGSVRIAGGHRLTVGWDSGEWTGELPVGCWRVEHPSPEAVRPGDAVLVVKTSCPPRRPSGRVLPSSGGKGVVRGLRARH